jgi:energy-coupling factor transporter transmembrane protein EcfT
MRDFLFKPRHIPGLSRRKPRTRLSTVRKLILMAITVFVLLLWLGGLRLSSIAITYIRTGTAKHLSLEELPIWQPPVCIVFMFLVMAAIVWRFRLNNRFIQFVRGDKNETHKG